MFGIFKNLIGGHGDQDQLKKAIDNKAYLIDVRTPGEFAGGSAIGAVNIPLDQLPGQLARLKDKENIVVFCRSGNRSAQAKRILEQNGYQQVVNGGTWQNVDRLIKEK